MSKYTDEQLKNMATEVLCSYNLGEPKAEMMIQILCQITQKHPNFIFNELTKFADKVI